MRRACVVFVVATLFATAGRISADQSAPPAQAPKPAPPAGTAAPPAPPTTIRMASNLQGQIRNITRNLRAAMDAMPEADYGFKPVPEVRSFAGSAAHTVASYYGYCANLTGKPGNVDNKTLESTLTTKAEILKSFDEAIAYCNQFTATPSSILEVYPATSRGPDGSTGKIEVEKGGLMGNFIGHSNEMYGYLAMYLRLKGIVPPTSKPR
ncbi:MAG TPA: DinB family protein [Vicinamibacterales bacterium]|nr:DinB family protein [Vicinamibacterales bacterium]